MTPHSCPLTSVCVLCHLCHSTCTHHTYGYTIINTYKMSKQQYLFIYLFIWVGLSKASLQELVLSLSLHLGIEL